MDKEKIKKDVEEIIKNFMEKLKDIEKEIADLNPKDFYLIKRYNLRKEDDKVEWKNFREKWFKVAPNVDEGYLITEKAKWKK